MSSNLIDNCENPSDSFVSSIDITTLLPQRPPFIMIGGLVHFDMVRTQSRTIISQDNLFVENGKMSATGLIENIAQTCAARIGYINKYILKRGIQIGVIGSISRLQVNDLPLVGSTIITTVEVAEEVFGMILAKASIDSDGRTYVTTEMKIAVRDEE